MTQAPSVPARPSPLARRRLPEATGRDPSPRPVSGIRPSPLRALLLARAAACDARAGHPSPAAHRGLTPYQHQIVAAAMAAAQAEVVAAEADTAADRERLRVLDEVLVPAAAARHVERQAQDTGEQSCLDDGAPATDPTDLPADLLAERAARRRARRLVSRRRQVDLAADLLEALRAERTERAARVTGRQRRAAARVRGIVALANRDEAFYRVRLLRRHPDGAALAGRWPGELVPLPGWAAEPPASDRMDGDVR